MLACVRGHLVLEQEGELAALADAVEVAVDLVVLAACGEERSRAAVSDGSLTLSCLFIRLNVRPADRLRSGRQDLIIVLIFGRAAVSVFLFFLF